MYRHVAPPSSERYTPPASASISAHSRVGFAGEMASPMLPSRPGGSPGLCVSSVQCSPPSVDLKIPPPGPPDTSCHGLRCACQKAAYSTSGLDGSRTRSEIPVESLRNSTLFHVLPPSVALYTPRSAFGPKACPWAPTHTMSGLAGCTRTREICCVSASPTKVQGLPPSAVLKPPSPCEMLPRIGYSPVPTYTMSGFDSLTPNAPMVPPKYLSVTDSQVSPPSVVLKRPPPVVPIQNSLGREPPPATATEGPPRSNPPTPHSRPANTVES